MLRTLLSILLILVASFGQSQTFQLTGRITNALREPLPFASVQVKELQSGTTTKEDGTYILQLEEGKYDIVYSLIGYKTQVVTVTITKNYIQNIILEDEKALLENVVIKSKYKDAATEIIKNVIRRKDSLVSSTGPWSANVYIKAVQHDSLPRKQKSKGKEDTMAINANRDIAGMAMTEVSLKLDYFSEQKIKEERLGIKKVGNNNDLFYLSATEGFFNFYNNLIKIPGLSTAQFLSPISYSGLLAYRFKTIKVEKRGNVKWYTIAVKPRLISNATVEGELTINDSSFTIEHARFIFPKYHLPQYDFFEVEQWYNNAMPLLSKQQFTYYSKAGKNKLSGITTVAYQDYELNKQFPKNHFGVEVSATTEDAYQRDTSFWNGARIEPLTTKEIKLIQYRDSIYRVTHTKQYLDSVDRETNRFTWKKLLLVGQTIYNRELERTWQLPPLPGVYQPFAFGGGRLNLSAAYFKTYKSRKNLHFFADVSYGFRNHDVNGSLNLGRMYNPFNRGFYGFSVRRDFDFIFSGDAWINMLKRSNLYLNNGFGVNHGIEIKNGLFIFTDLDFALRRSLNDYKTGSTIDSLFGKELGQNTAIAFESYNALYGRLRLEYTPFQRYIREPKEKVILGSKWPTLYTSYRKGIPGPFDSKVDFDYWDVGIKQQITVGLFGILHYNVNSGTFLNTRDLRLVDYQFQRRGDPLLFANPDAAFQALDSSFPVFNRFYQGHLVHEFNGYFVNKVPLLKKLGLREIAGGGFLYVPERNLTYAETFIGLERVFKWPFSLGSKFKMGVYMVGSVANQFTNPITFKVGITSWDKRRNKWH
ncbi:MAG: hypothetical protein JWR18_2149 [Segetibacter sp.]|nr:hypothetical protein [Segetibacter sp.]